MCPFSLAGGSCLAWFRYGSSSAYQIVVQSNGILNEGEKDS